MVIVSSPQRKYINRFAVSCANELGIAKRSTMVIVRQVRSIPSKDDDDHYVGLCDYCANTDIVTIKLATHQGDGKRIARQQILQTLAHEMIHAKQYIKRQMVDLPDHDDGRWRVRWGRKVYCDNPNRLPPWELEAYRDEKALYESCYNK